MNGKLKLVTETRESSLFGGWTSETRLEWSDEHGTVWLLRSSELGQEVLSVHIMDAGVSDRIRTILGDSTPVMENLPDWGMTGVEGVKRQDFVGDLALVKALVNSVSAIARRQYAAGLRAEADRVESGYPKDKRSWENRGFNSARAFCLRTVIPESRINW